MGSLLCVTQHLASSKLRSVSGVTSKQQTHTCILFARASFVTVNGSLTNSKLSGHNGADCWEEDTLYHASHISFLACLFVNVLTSSENLHVCVKGEVREIPEFWGSWFWSLDGIWWQIDVITGPLSPPCWVKLQSSFRQWCLSQGVHLSNVRLCTGLKSFSKWFPVWNPTLPPELFQI